MCVRCLICGRYGFSISSNDVDSRCSDIRLKQKIEKQKLARIALSLKCVPDLNPVAYDHCHKTITIGNKASGALSLKY